MRNTETNIVNLNKKFNSLNRRYVNLDKSSTFGLSEVEQDLISEELERIQSLMSAVSSKIEELN
jgi:hypothetical protein